LRNNQTVAIGQAYPTSDRSILHANKIDEDYIKVQVDTVIRDFEMMPVPEKTRTDEVNLMQDTVGAFIQWPKNALKVYVVDQIIIY
jgi:hypothetical protein